MSTGVFRVLVVLLLTVIAATGVYFVWRSEQARDILPDWAFGPLADDRGIAAIQTGEINVAVMMYYRNRRELPSRLEDLLEEDGSGMPYLDEIPKDPWGKPFAIEVLGERDWRIVSDGPDGKPGTDDDVIGP